MVSSPSDKPEKPVEDQADNPAEGSRTQKKPRAKHLPIYLTGKAITEFSNQSFNDGKISALQLCEIADVLKQKGPREAMEKLAKFMKEIDQPAKPEKNDK